MIYNYLKKKLFLNKQEKEKYEFTENELVQLFGEEVANELNVNLEKEREDK